MSFGPPQVLAPVFGTQIEDVDWNQLLNYVLQTTGFCTAFQQGQPSASTLIQPLVITPNGTMSPVIGGTSGTPQFVLCQGLLCGSATATPFTVANNAGGTRTDTIWIQPNLVTVLTVSRSIENNTGVKAPGPVPVVISSIAAFYQESGSPAPTGGTWTQFATIAVPNGATSITSGEITYLLPVMNPTGPQGAAGHGSTTTNGGFVIPNVASSVNVTVLDVTAFPIGATLIASDGSHAMVGTVTGVSGLVLSVQCDLVPIGSVGNTVASGAVVSFAGLPGTNGTNGTPGSNGHGSTTTTGGAVIPAIGSTVAVGVVDGTAFPNGTFVILSDGTHAFAGEISSGGGTTSLTVLNIGVVLGAVGNTVASGGVLTFSGAQLTTAFFAAALPVQSASPGSTPQTETINLVIPNVGTTWYVEIDANTSCGSSGTAVGALTQTAGGSPTGGVLMTNGSGLGGYQKYVAEFAAGQTLTFQFVGTFTGTGPYITTLTAKAERIS